MGFLTMMIPHLTPDNNVLLVIDFINSWLLFRKGFGSSKMPANKVCVPISRIQVLPGYRACRDTPAGNANR
jgi:hypothetical protein